MYLTRLIIDPYERAAAYLLRDTYAMHQTLCNLADAPRHEAALLHRVVRRKNQAAVYVYSAEPLDCSQGVAGLRFDAELELTPLLDSLRPNQFLAFDLTAVPSKKVKPADPGRKNSRRVPLQTPDERMEWLGRHFERHGLELVDAFEREPIDVSARQRRLRNSFEMRGYHYTGHVRVADPKRAREAICNGIGPERAFGFGMLMVRPL